jgi:hypothetical protein
MNRGRCPGLHRSVDAVFVLGGPEHQETTTGPTQLGVTIFTEPEDINEKS